MTKSFFSIIIFVLVCFTEPLTAQETLAVSGTSLTGDGGIISYSVGQTAFNSYTGSSGFIHQGVHQPYEIYVISELGEDQNVRLEVKIYPNPASDYLILNILNVNPEKYSYNLFNFNGLVLKSSEISSHETVIPMEELPPGEYFLKVMNGQNKHITFKVTRK